MTIKSDDTQVNLEQARKFGRVSDDGHVFVIVEGEEYAVGQLPGASEEEALAYFARKFENVEAQVSLLESRVENNSPAADLQKGISSIGAQIGVRNMVGDYASLQERLSALNERIIKLGEAQQQERAENRERALAAREEIVAEAEQIAAQDVEKIHWKNSHARMNELFDAWKQAQREIHLAKSVEDELWKRFRAARTTFDRNRRAHFSQLDDRNARIKRAKEELIARAEQLSSSTDWSETSREYGKLMRAWKEVPRGSRREDDKLWARFRAAQDVFFDARNAAEAQQDEAYAENLKVKEALLVEARALLPVTDISAAKKAFEKILDRWDAAGRVPRADLRRIDSELRKIQDEINGAEAAKWKKNDPAKAAQTRCSPRSRIRSPSLSLSYRQHRLPAMLRRSPRRRRLWRRAAPGRQPLKVSTPKACSSFLTKVQKFRGVPYLGDPGIFVFICLAMPCLHALHTLRRFSCTYCRLCSRWFVTGETIRLIDARNVTHNVQDMLQHKPVP